VAVTIPKEFLDELKLKPGTPVVVEKEGNGLLITSKARRLASDVDSKFAKMVDEFFDEHDDVLTELSQK